MKNLIKSKYPLLSVLIPTFNRPKYLDELLYSLSKQDMNDYEIIVKDNHSKNVEEYQKVIDYYKKIFTQRNIVLQFIINKKNIGVVNNKHEGVVKDCRGEYCIIIDDDDFLIHKNILKRLLDTMLSDKNISVVTGDVSVFIQENGKPDAKNLIDEGNEKILSEKPTIINGTKYFCGYWSIYGPRQPSSTLFNRSLAIERKWNSVECNDQSIHLLLSPGKKVAVFSEKLSVCRLHEAVGQRLNNRRMVTPLHVFNSHTAIIQWKYSVKKYSSIKKVSLFIWYVKTMILKDEGPIRWLHSQSYEKLNSFLELLREYNYFHYLVVKYLSPQMIKYSEQKNENISIIKIRKKISQNILFIDRRMHDPKFKNDNLKSKKNKVAKNIYNKASLFKKKGKIKKSEELFKKLIKNSKDNYLMSGSYFHLGEMNYINKNYEKADEMFQRCVKINPNHSKAKEYIMNCNEIVRN